MGLGLTLAGAGAFAAVAAFLLTRSQAPAWERKSSKLCFAGRLDANRFVKPSATARS